jgi:hypothetical protein
MYPQKQDTQNVAESKYGEQVSSMRGYERHVSCHNGKRMDVKSHNATAGRDIEGLYPQKQDTQNVAGSKCGRQVSSMRGYERPVSCHNGKQKKRREGIKPQREERGTKAVYPVKQDTQSIAWRSCGKQVSYMKGYKGHVSYRN